MKKNDCVFCNIIQGKIPSDIIFEDKYTLVTLDIDEVVKGHILVIWKKHLTNISDLTLKEYLIFSKLLWKTEKVLLQITNKNRSIIFKTGSLVSHFHFHIYPVSLNTQWGKIKDFIDKDVVRKKNIRYKYKKGEKEDFILNLRRLIGKN